MKDKGVTLIVTLQIKRNKKENRYLSLACRPSQSLLCELDLNVAADLIQFRKQQK